jgi:flavorubredoxin
MKIRLKSVMLILTLAIGSSACERSPKQEDVKSDFDAVGISTTTMTESGKPVKWRMPEAMMKHMRNLDLDVRTIGSSAEKDHTALATKIDEHTKQLISSCTMDGKAHAALHDWLMPFLQLNKDYAAAPDVATKSAKFKEIQNSLAAFHERFE